MGVWLWYRSMRAGEWGHLGQSPQTVLCATALWQIWIQLFLATFVATGLAPFPKHILFLFLSCNLLEFCFLIALKYSSEHLLLVPLAAKGTSSRMKCSLLFFLVTNLNILNFCNNFLFLIGDDMPEGFENLVFSKYCIKSSHSYAWEAHVFPWNCGKCTFGCLTKEQLLFLNILGSYKMV